MKMTKEHFEDAAYRLRWSTLSKAQRTLVENFLVQFFRAWNPGFSEDRFRRACIPGEPQSMRNAK